MLAYVCYTGSMVGVDVKGEPVLNQPLVARVNPWLIVAIVAVVLLLAAMLMAPAALHGLNMLLQSHHFHIDTCSGAQGPC